MHGKVYNVSLMVALSWRRDEKGIRNIADFNDGDFLFSFRGFAAREGKTLGKIKFCEFRKSSRAAEVPKVLGRWSLGDEDKTDSLDFHTLST
jgi:hypothetical protein